MIVRNFLERFFERNPWAGKLLIIILAALGVVLLANQVWALGLCLTLTFGAAIVLPRYVRMIRRQSKRFKASAPFVQPVARPDFKLQYGRHLWICTYFIALGASFFWMFWVEDELRPYAIMMAFLIAYGIYRMLYSFLFPSRIRLVKSGIEIEKGGITFRADWDKFRATTDVEEKWPKLNLVFRKSPELARGAKLAGGRDGAHAFRKKYGTSTIYLTWDTRELGVDPAYLESLISLYKRRRSLRDTLDA